MATPGNDRHTAGTTPPTPSHGVHSVPGTSRGSVNTEADESEDRKSAKGGTPWLPFPRPEGKAPVTEGGTRAGKPLTRRRQHTRSKAKAPREKRNLRDFVKRLVST